MALEDLVNALREHLAAAAERRGEQDPRVEATYTAVADAFELYEDALYTAYDEVTPFELYDDIEDAREDRADPDPEDGDSGEEELDEEDLDLYDDDDDDDGIDVDR